MNILRIFRSRFARALCLGACLVGCAEGLRAAVPASLTYQGVYTENNIPVSGTRSMTFRLTNSDGSLEYWNSTPLSVALSTGIFRVQLQISAPLDWGALAPYLEVSIGTTTLLPRDPVTATVYALHASTAEYVISGAIANDQVASGAGIAPAKIAGTAMTLTLAETVTGVKTFNADLLMGSGSLGAASGSSGVSVSTSLFIPSGRLGVGLSAPAGPLHVRAVGQDALFVDPSFARIGLGTTSPTERLEVNDGSIKLSGAGSSLIFPDNSIMTSASLGSAGSITNTGDAVVQSDSDVNSIGDLILRTGANDRLHIANNGNVGVGTASPASRLHVGFSTARDIAFSADSQSSWMVGLPTGGNTSTINNQLIGIYAAGNGALSGGVVSNPAAASGAALNLYGNDSTAAGDLIVEAGGSVGTIRLKTSGTERFSITPSGNIGVGTTAPSFRLHVASGAGFAGDILVISTDTSNMFRVTGSGEVFAARYFGDGAGLTGVFATVSASTPITGDGTAASPLALDSSSVTLQGNAFNGDNQLVQLNGSSQLPPLDGSQLTDIVVTSIAADTIGSDEIVDSTVTLADLDTASVDTRYLSTATAQTITGIKTLNADWVNTANPWADNEVSNTLTITGGSVASSLLTGALPDLDGSQLTDISATNVAVNSVGPDQIVDSTVTLADLDTASVDARYLSTSTAQTVTGIKTINADWVNTANPWADNEVDDTLTIGAAGSVDNAALDSSSVTLLGPTIDAGELPSDGYASSYVNVAGDAMTGPLTLVGSTLTVTGDAFSVGASTFVAKGGNVGIGTADPAELLHIAKPVEGIHVGALIENSQANTATSVNEIAEIRFGFGGSNDVIRLSAYKTEDFDVVANESAGLSVWGRENGSTSEQVQFRPDGSLRFLRPSGQVQFDQPGTQGVLYKDAGGTFRNALMFPGGDLVVLSNMAANGTIEIRANTATAGSGGEVTVARFEDDKISLLTSGGNVGIGTVSPDSLLDVAGQASFGDDATKSTFTATGNLEIASGAGIALQDAAPAGNAVVFGSGANEDLVASDVAGLTGGADTSLHSHSGLAPGAHASSHEDGGGDALSGSLTLSSLTLTSNAFSVGGSTLTVTDGNVGIGETAPAAKLEVKPVAADNYTVQISSQDGTAVMVVDKAGNVGIGTTDASQKLVVEGGPVRFGTDDFGNNRASLQLSRATENYLTITIPATNTAGLANVAGSPDTLYLANEDTTLVFKTGVVWDGDWATTGVEGMRIVNGSVGIGTTSPYSTMTVVGALGMSGIGEPTGKAAGRGIIYYDITAGKFKVSENDGAYGDLVGGGSSGWNDAGSVVQLQTATDNVVIASTLTVQGNAFSVGGSILTVTGGNVGIGLAIPDVDELLHVSKAVDGSATLLLLENSQANVGSSLNETAEIRFGFGGNNSVARIVAQKRNDYSTTSNEDSRLGFFIDIDGTDTEIARFRSSGLIFTAGSKMIEFSGTAGGGNQGISYKDLAGSLRNSLMFPGGDVVVLSNRASNGTVQIGANTATAGSVGEVIVATFEDNEISLLTSGGKVGIGTNIPSDLLTLQAASNSTLAINQIGSAAPRIKLQRAKGSPGSETAVLSGDPLGLITFQGWNSVAYVDSVRIAAKTTQNWSTTARGSKLEFKTTDNDTTTLDVRMLIDQNGNIGIGTTSPDQFLHVSTAVDGSATLVLIENSQANAASSLNETAEIRFGFGGNNDVARIAAIKTDDFTATGKEDSRISIFTRLDGVINENFQFRNDGTIQLSGSTTQIKFNNDTPGGISPNGPGIVYLDSLGFFRSALMFPGSDLVVLSNRAVDGTVEIRADTAAGGSGGEVTVATFEDDKIALLTSGGSVGIGTSAPGAHLEVVADAADAFILKISSQNGTALLSVDRFGSVDISSFTRLGSGAPAIRMKKLTGTTGATEGSLTDIPHGLTLSKIIGLSALVVDTNGNVIPPALTYISNFQYDAHLRPTVVRIKLSDTNSGFVVNGAITVLLTYEE